MFQLLETIQVKDNRLHNLIFHNARVNDSRKRLFHATDLWDLAECIKLPRLVPQLTYRCRFLYAMDVDYIEFIPYIPRTINKLHMVIIHDLDYAFKYADRQRLDELRSGAVEDPDADILLIRDGLVTDTSFSNIAFYDGKQWVTPDSPILKGTKRAFYMQSGMLKEQRIAVTDILGFQKARLINAMLDLETGRDIDVKNILPA
jgi:4-amino-4-deoxychorismate lyase